MIKELLKFEEQVKKLEKKLGEEVSRIDRPSSLFGKHRYPIEQGLLKIAGFEILRGINVIDPTVSFAGFIPELYSEKEKKKYVEKLLTRGRKILEEKIGA